MDCTTPDSHPQNPKFKWRKKRYIDPECTVEDISSWCPEDQDQGYDGDVDDTGDVDDGGAHSSEPHLPNETIEPPSPPSDSFENRGYADSARGEAGDRPTATTRSRTRLLLAPQSQTHGQETTQAHAPVQLSLINDFNNLRCEPTDHQDITMTVPHSNPLASSPSARPDSGYGEVQAQMQPQPQTQAHRQTPLKRSHSDDSLTDSDENASDRDAGTSPESYHRFRKMRLHSGHLRVASHDIGLGLGLSYDDRDRNGDAEILDDEDVKGRMEIDR